MNLTIIIVAIVALLVGAGVALLLNKKLTKKTIDAAKAVGSSEKADEIRAGTIKTADDQIKENDDLIKKAKEQIKLNKEVIKDVEKNTN